jgi:putative hemolysin
MELLENFKNSGAPMAFVVDEYGVVQGIVTVHDLMEAITGEFVTEDPSDAWAVQRDDGSWLLDGHIPIVELKDRLNLKSVPEEEKGRYQTLSGMVMLLTGKLPTEADKVVWESWQFEVVDMDGKIIDKILATRLQDNVIETLQDE